VARLKTKGAGVINEAQTNANTEALYGLTESIQEKLVHEFGIEEYPRPSGAPEPLSEVDVGAMANIALGNLYSQYVAYSVYLNNKLTDIRCLSKTAKIVLKNVSADIKLQLLSEGVPKDQVSAQVRAHPKFNELEIESLKFEIMSEKVETYAKGYRDQAAALSRNIELRKLEFEQQLREGHVQKTKGMATATGDASRRRGLGRTVRTGK